MFDTSVPRHKPLIFDASNLYAMRYTFCSPNPLESASVIALLKIHLPVYREVWRLAFPVILTNLLMTLVNIVDVFMVGRLGPVEIAAVGMANTVRMLVMVGILSVTAGAMALAAQAKGARDPARLSFVTRQTLSLTVLLALVLSVIGYYARRAAVDFLKQ